MKLSNKFTLARVVCAPLVFILYFIPIWFDVFVKPSTLIMIPVLIFLELTDYWDGHYARKHNEVSDFGKIFDPFADVMLHLTTFCCFLFSYGSFDVRTYAYMPIVIFMLIMYREMTMTFLRMCAIKKGVSIAARKGGKFKTVMYVVAGFYALALENVVRLEIPLPNFEAFRIVSLVLFCICLICSYVSFFDYIVHFMPVFKGEKQ